MGGNQLTASQKAQIFSDKLRDEEKGLAPNSPLRKALDGYINQLKNIPNDVSTTVDLIEAPSRIVRAGQAPQHRQLGGPIQPNRDYIVGEKQQELLRMNADGTGYVTPMGPPDGRAGSGRGPVVHIENLNAAGMSAWDLGQEIAWLAKTRPY